MPPLCRETQSLGQQMSKEPLGINGLIYLLSRDVNCVMIIIAIKVTSSYFLEKRASNLNEFCPTHMFHLNV